MANESPASILFDRDGYDLAIAPGDTITVDQPGFLALGKDGSTSRIITLDSLGRSIVVGAGTAGSGAGGLITIQGDAAGTPIPISVASLPLPAGAATEATLATRLADATFTARVNTLGQKTMANSMPVVISSDQSIITITGAITGTVTSNQGTAAALANAWPIKISDGTNYAPLTNAAPIGNEQALIVRNIPSGTQVISGTVTATVAGTVTANQGTPASLSNPWPVQLSNGTNTPIITNTTPGGSDQGLVVRNIPSGTQAISAATLPLPTGAATEVTLATRLSKADFEARINTLGQKTKTNSTPVVFASDQDALAIYLAAPFGSRTGVVTASVTLAGGSAGTINRIGLTTYTEQTTNATRSIKSSSASDTSAGTGARKVRITYYDQTVEGPFTTEVILNGTTAVATSVSNICFIESIFVIEVGSVGSNVGTVSLYANNLGTGTVIGSIGLGGITAGIGDNRTFWGHHYVPVGDVATLATFVVSAESGGSGTNAIFFFRAADPTVANAPEVIISDLLLSTTSIVRILSYPIKVLGPARIVTYAVPAVNNARLNASIDYSEVAV